MRAMGLAGAVRGRAWVITTRAAAAGRPADLVERQFVATRPNQLWVSDFTYVATWSGFVYVAFVIDVFARRIVGWRVSASMRTDFVLDAMEQAIYARRGDGRDRGVRSRPWSSPRSRGWTGSICGGCWDRSGTSHRPSSKPSTMPRPRWPDSTNSVSDVPGTLQARDPDATTYQFVFVAGLKDGLLASPPGGVLAERLIAENDSLLAQYRELQTYVKSLEADRRPERRQRPRTPASARAR